MTDMEKYILARWTYSLGEPIISDAEYTVLDRAMRATNPDSPYCSRSWSSDPCPVELLRALNREDLIKAVVLSDKTESIPSLNSYAEIREVYNDLHDVCSVSFKIDGWNIQASYYNGELVQIQTRGRSRDAIDASKLRPLFPERIPMMGRVLVVVECCVPDADFQWFRTNFGVTSQRGAVSTALANGGDCLQHVVVLAHGVRASSQILDTFTLLEEWGFQTPMHARVHSYEELMDQVRAFSAYKEQYGYPTDGLVVMGTSAYALRVDAWEEPIYKSYVTGYTETYGPHSIAIQCTIFPIQLPNSVQRQLPATNLNRIVSLNLRPGAPVAFRIASSAIADIDEDATRLLQKEHEEHWETFRHMVEWNESLKLR